MIEMRASEIAGVIGGQLHGNDVTVTSHPVLNSSDAVPGSIFLAFKGEKVDGHSFVSDARTRGAVLAIVTSPVDGSYILVKDVQESLGKLAHHVRTQLKELVVIGLTGSQGKTTTKELLSHLLSTQGETVAPQGNFNNELGAPISLLQCSASTRYCIIEMGARHKGDIAHLASLVVPNIGVVLKVGTAHLGEFGSVQAIAETKGELIDSLSHNGIAILGTYDEYTPKMRAHHDGKVMTFGEGSECDVRASDIEFREGFAHFELVTSQGRAAVGLRVAGMHQVANALAVASVGVALGFSVDVIASALSTAESHARWRMEILQLPELVLINDAYNASPESMVAALQTLRLFAQERGGESWAFLGKMHELGESSEKEHAAIGTLASELGIDHLVCVAAPEFATALQDLPITVHICRDKTEALELAEEISRGDVVLIKASRSEKLEELADGIQENWKARVENE